MTPRNVNSWCFGKLQGHERAGGPFHTFAPGGPVDTETWRSSDLEAPLVFSSSAGHVQPGRHTGPPGDVG